MPGLSRGKVGIGCMETKKGYPIDAPIPIRFLQKIVATPIGEKAKNPTKTGVKTITVTQRAGLALILRGFR